MSCFMSSYTHMSIHILWIPHLVFLANYSVIPLSTCPRLCLQHVSKLCQHCLSSNFISLAVPNMSLVTTQPTLTSK